MLLKIFYRKKQCSMKPFPIKYQWMVRNSSPNIWLEARKHYGLLEKEKGKIVPELIAWCKEMNVPKLYPGLGNDFAWCGLFVAIVVSRAGWKVVDSFLGAVNWMKFGIAIYINGIGFLKGMQVCWMDILVFKRPGGYHVAFAVAQNKKAYLCYGGNQSNAVGLAWIEKSRLIGVRRPEYKTYQPVPLKMLSETGELSVNEQ